MRTSILLVLPVLFALGACGARSALLGSDFSPGTTGAGGTGTGGAPATCDPMDEPKCFDCNQIHVPALCADQGMWECPVNACPMPAAIWAKGAGGAGMQGGSAIAVGPDGAIVVAGSFSGSIDLGGDLLSSFNASIPPSFADGFIAKFLPDGTHVWSRAFGVENQDAAGDVAVDAAGNIVLLGGYTSAQTLDGFALPGGPNPDKLFVAKLDPDGKVLFARGFVNSGGSSGTYAQLDLAPNGDIAGYAPDGTPRYAVVFAGAAPPFDGMDRFRVAVDPKDDVVLAGQFREQFQLGAGTLASAGDYDLVVAKLDPDGNPKWAERFGDAQMDRTFGIAIDPPTGDILVTGQFLGTLDFGFGPMVDDGYGDLFVARLPPTGPTP